MGLHRTAIRQATRDALASASRFRGFTEILGWSQSVDADTLPVYGFSTPREVSGATDYDAHQRRVELKCKFVRMAEDDIEDQIDLDADAAETAILPVMRAAYLNAEVVQTESLVSGEGKMRVGTVEITFSILLHTDMPA